MVRTASREKIDSSAFMSGSNTALVAGFNTDSLGGKRVPASCRCIAKECAMWRWIDKKPERKFCAAPRPHHRATIEPPRPNGVPASWEWHPDQNQEYQTAGWIEPEHEAMASRKGYCGLAGRPEVA